MSASPFSHLTLKPRWQARLGRWRDALLRPLRPARIAAERPGPPNLLLVGVDTLRADHLGLGGYAPPTSPHLDRLAGRGVVFADVTAAAPWTLPSFASALTGRLPGLHGAYLSGATRNMDNMAPGRLHPDLPTLAGHLRAAGYRTAAFYSNQFFAFGLAESFDHHVYLNLPAGEIARQAEEWMRRHADRPFFCFLLLNDPHEPTTPDWEDLQPFLPGLAAQGAGTGAADLQPYARWGEAPGVDLTRAAHPAGNRDRQALATKVAIYDATIRYVDRVIGGMQANLESMGLAEDTLVSVFSDHGEEFLDHADFSHLWQHDPRGIHGIGHGHSHFQEVLRVPWLAWGPGIAAGQQATRPVSLMDLAPTLLAWLGLPPLPGLAEAAAGQGQLGPALIGHSQAEPAAEPLRLILSEAIAYGPDLVALRRGHLKLIAGREGRVLGLFDLAADPGEQRDLATAEPRLVAELLDLLAQWRRSGLGASGQAGSNWKDMDDTVRQRLKDLGYSD